MSDNYGDFNFDDTDDFFGESFENEIDNQDAPLFYADQQPTPFMSQAPNTPANLPQQATPAAQPQPTPQPVFQQLQFNASSTPGGFIAGTNTLNSTSIPSRAPLSMVDGQPDLKKVRVDTSEPFASDVIKTEDDDDDDIKEETGCEVFESEEVRKGIAKLSYEGTGIKETQQGVIDSAKEMTSYTEFKSGPPGAAAAAAAAATSPAPSMSASATGMTSSSTSTHFPHIFKPDYPPYDLKITNVVSKVSLLSKKAAEDAVNARENQENKQTNGEAADGGGAGPKKGRGKRGEKAQAKKKPSPFDLRMIADSMLNTKYTSRFSAARISMKSPTKATGLIFGCGTVVCTGTKTIEDNKKASKKLARSIKKVTKIDVSFLDYTVVNMTATVDVHFDINLTSLSRESDSATYDPEQFPGVIFKIPEPKMTLIIFSTGKITVVGAKCEEDIKKTMDEFRFVLIKHKKKKTGDSKK